MDILSQVKEAHAVDTSTGKKINVQPLFDLARDIAQPHEAALGLVIADQILACQEALNCAIGPNPPSDVANANVYLLRITRAFLAMTEQ